MDPEKQIKVGGRWLLPRPTIRLEIAAYTNYGAKGMQKFGLMVDDVMNDPDVLKLIGEKMVTAMVRKLTSTGNAYSFNTLKANEVEDENAS